MQIKSAIILGLARDGHVTFSLLELLICLRLGSINAVTEAHSQARTI
jgi:hypothetical protein